MDLAFLQKNLVSSKVPKPLSGTLSGHAAGEPFAKHVYDLIKSQFPNQTYSQFEYLNFLYNSTPNAKTYQERYKLISFPAVAFLISRGKSAIASWSIEKPFDEKQNDTADTLVIEDRLFNIVDVKTTNLDKSAQPPNIISAWKLAQMCKLMIENKQYNTHTITYVGVDWKLVGEFLVCEDVCIKSLFKADPSKLYINWAAALQIQFHPKSLDQTYTGSVENWCKDYVKHFTKQVHARSETMVKKFSDPFDGLLE